MTISSTLGGDATISDSAARPGDLDLAPGAEIGRYVVVERVGAGGMGVVLAADDPELERRVALKVLFEGGSGDRAEQRRTRMIREARAMAAVSHPNVVTVLDVGEAGGRVFLAMELVEGETLRSWLEAERNADEVLDVFRDAARGLSAIHAVGLVHRDFKPENVLIGRDRRVQVTDFGLVRGETPPSLDDATHEPSRSTDGLTRDGAIMGTPAYMAPEQAAGKDADPLSDQFSFCVALYEALFGVPPYAGETLAQRVVSWSSGRIQPPVRNTKLTRIRRALIRGLDPAPENRWPTLGMLLGELSSPRRWRSTVLSAGVSAIVLGVLAVVATARQDEGAECVLNDVDESWNAEVRGSLRAAVERTGEPIALWDPVEAELDRYAARWSAAREDVCNAELEPDLRDIAASCLDARRRSFAAVIRVFGEPTRDVLLGASKLASELEPPEVCAEPARTPAALARQRVDSKVLDTIDEALALSTKVSFGDPDQPKRSVEAALEQAKAWGLCEEEAELMFLLGRIERRRTGRGKQLELWENAQATADACGAFAHAAQIAAAIASFHVSTGDDLDAARRWIHHAEAALARGSGEATASDVFSAHARLALRQRDLDEAERYAQMTLDSLAPSVHNRRAAAAQHTMATVLRAKGRLDEAMEHARRGIELFEASAGSMHPDLAAMLTGIGNLHVAGGDNAQAIAAFERALAAWRATAPHEPRRLKTLANLGLVLRLEGRHADALERLDQALELAREHHTEDYFFTSIRFQRARTLTRLGRYDEAEREALAGRDGARGLRSERVGVIALVENELARGDLQRARSRLEEFAELCDPVGDDACRGQDLLMRGQIELAEGNEAEAIETLRTTNELLPPGEIDYVLPLPADVEAALRSGD